MPGSHQVAALVLLGTLAACGDTAPTSDAARDAGRPSALGAPAPTPVPTPRRPMDRLERPVAERLVPRLRDDELTLEYVDCPPWHGRVPARLRCEGYVDGVVGEVDVELSEGERGGIEFDAWLDHGVLATARLVHRLENAGHAGVNCGDIPAYPATEGLRIVCRVHDGGERAYLVATVTGVDGTVRIGDY
jgi:hypothetical protein